MASSYCSLNIWSISKDKYNFLFTIPNANEAKINKLLALSKGRIASCSFDEIKIFNFSQKANSSDKRKQKISYRINLLYKTKRNFTFWRIQNCAKIDQHEDVSVYHCD